MLKPSEVQRFHVDVSLGDVPRDVLEFNYNQLAKGFVSYAAEMKRQHDAELHRLRNLIDVGQHVTVLMAKAQREGRKTIRVADVLEEAQRIVDGRSE